MCVFHYNLERFVDMSCQQEIDSSFQIIVARLENKSVLQGGLLMLFLREIATRRIIHTSQIYQKKHCSFSCLLTLNSIASCGNFFRAT